MTADTKVKEVKGAGTDGGVTSGGKHKTNLMAPGGIQGTIYSTEPVAPGTVITFEIG